MSDDFNAPTYESLEDEVQQLRSLLDAERAKVERLELELGGRCPYAEMCKRCPCAADDDVCFPGERLRAKVEELEKALREIVAVEDNTYDDDCIHALTRCGDIAQDALASISGEKP